MTDVAPVLGPIGDLGAHAIAYAEAGLAVFPVNPADKTPMVSQYEATTDTAQVEAWWLRWPAALIGHRLAPDEVILDIDPRHGGMATWQALRAEFGPFPATRAHRSGRGDGGAHTWWKVAADWVPNIKRLNAWARQRGLGQDVGGGRWSAGIDVLRHTHRYTILPPSPHPDTRQPYRWGEAGPTAPVLAMPGALLALLAPDATPEPDMAPLARAYDEESVAEWFSTTRSWADVLAGHGWALAQGDGDSDGSRWRHPNATHSFSATTKHGCLFVYSPNTPFEPTEPSAARGYTRFKAWALLEHSNDTAAAYRAAHRLRGDPEPVAVDLESLIAVEAEAGMPVVGGIARYFLTEEALWNATSGADWLVEPVIARGRAHAIYAKGGTGKSLFLLHLAAALATGRAVLGRPAGEPVDVLYIDLEMTVEDVRDRLEGMGYGPDDRILTHLHYALLPPLDGIDTERGAIAIAAAAEACGAQWVVIDTTARAVDGDENEADTFRRVGKFLGIELKRRGIAYHRLDHAGKDAAKGQRGSSAKNDDVDIVQRISRTDDDGFKLETEKQRVSWAPKVVTVKVDEGDDGYQRLRVVGGGESWPAGTKGCADALDRLGVPIGASQNEAVRQLRAAGLKASNNIARAAQKYRAEAAKAVDNLVAGAPRETGRGDLSHAGAPQRAPKRAQALTRGNAERAPARPEARPNRAAPPPLGGGAPGVDPERLL